MTTTVKNSPNNTVTLTELNNSVSVTNNNTGTVVNITEVDATTVSVLTSGPQGPKGDTGTINDFTGDIIITGNISASSLHTLTGNISASSIHISASGPSSLTINSGEYDNAVNIYSTDDRVNISLSDSTTNTTKIVGVGAEGNDLILRSDIGGAKFRVGGIDRISVFEIDNSGSITTVTDITASGNISASGTIIASNLSGTNTGDQDLSTYMLSDNTASFAVTSSNVLFGNITASGNISASGDLIVSNITASNKIFIQTTGTPSNLSLNRTDGKQISLIAGLNGAAIRYDNTSGSDFSIHGMTNPALATSYPEITSPDFSITGSKIGIGTFLPSEKLTVEGSISASGDIIVEGLTTLGGNTSVDGNLTVGTGYRFKFTNENVGLYRDSNDLRLAGFNSIQFFSEEAEMLSQTERMRLTNQGRLGIGTTSPSEMLTVAGNISASGELIIGSNEKLYLNKSEDTYIQSMAGDIARIVAGGNQMLILDYDTGNRAVFGNGTKVYIGNNNNALPSAELQVQGMISASGTGSFEQIKLNYDNMPTSDPSIKGVVYRSSSAGIDNLLFISAG